MKKKNEKSKFLWSFNIHLNLIFSSSLYRESLTAKTSFHGLRRFHSSKHFYFLQSVFHVVKTTIFRMKIISFWVSFHFHFYYKYLSRTFRILNLRESFDVYPYDKFQFRLTYIFWHSFFVWFVIKNLKIDSFILHSLNYHHAFMESRFTILVGRLMKSFCFRFNSINLSKSLKMLFSVIQAFHVNYFRWEFAVITILHYFEVSITISSDMILFIYFNSTVAIKKTKENANRSYSGVDFFGESEWMNISWKKTKLR